MPQTPVAATADDPEATATLNLTEMARLLHEGDAPAPALSEVFRPPAHLGLAEVLIKDAWEWAGMVCPARLLPGATPADAYARAVRALAPMATGRVYVRYAGDLAPHRPATLVVEMTVGGNAIKLWGHLGDLIAGCDQRTGVPVLVPVVADAIAAASR